MDEVIAFKLVKDGVHTPPPPEGNAKIITFTGGWHAPMSDREGNSAPGLAKAVWYECCRNNFLYSLGLLGSCGTGSLGGAGNGSGEAMLAATLAPSTILERQSSKEYPYKAPSGIQTRRRAIKIYLSPPAEKFSAQIARHTPPSGEVWRHWPPAVARILFFAKIGNTRISSKADTRSS